MNDRAYRNDALKKHGIFVSDGVTQTKIKCPKCSEHRKPAHRNEPCLSVNVEKQVWNCHNCGWAGHSGSGSDKQGYHTPSFVYMGLQPKMIEYFAERGISEKTLERMKVTWGVSVIPGTKEKVTCIVFPYFKDDKVVNIKYRFDREDGEKVLWQAPQCESVVYGYNDIEGKDEIICVEGEPDLFSLNEVGFFNVFSLPIGGINAKDKNIEGKLKSLNGIEKDLEKAKKIILATDDDETGRRTRDELERRIGKYKCYRVLYPEGCKDANDVLRKHGRQALIDCINSASLVPMDGLIKIKTSDILDEISSIYLKGFRQPERIGVKAIDDKFRCRPGELTVVSGIPSHGKALAIDTPISTASGFKIMRDVNIGDVVFDENGEKCNVVNATEIMFDRPCYEITFSDGAKVVCDAEHQWFTRTDKARRSLLQAKKKGRFYQRALKPKGKDQSHLRTFPKVVKTIEIADSVFVARDGRANHSIRLAGAVEYDYKDLPIDPYVLGAWLGDGSSNEGGITLSDKEIIDEIQKAGYDVRKRKAKYLYGVKNLKIELRKLGVLNNKRIPEIYLLASINQRMALLQGLMDTDGTATSKDRRCEFTNVNRKLAEQVFELVCSLGIKATFVTGDAKLYGKIVSKKYRVSFSTCKSVFRVARKLERIKKQSNEKQLWRYIVSCKKVESVPVKCIEVDSPSHLYLCTKSFIPTHNSLFVDFMTMMLAKKSGWDIGVFSPEHYPVGRYYARLMQMYVGKPLTPGMNERMNASEMREAIEFIQEHFVLMGHSRAGMTIDNILELAKAAVLREGIKALVIDPWNRFEHNINGMNEAHYVAQSLDKIDWFGRTHDVHTFLVAHPKLLQKDKRGQYPRPSLYDISGGANFRNFVYNGLIVWRDIESNKNITEIDVQKIKFEECGQFGTIVVGYDSPSRRFFDLPQDVVDNYLAHKEIKNHLQEPKRSSGGRRNGKSDLKKFDDSEERREIVYGNQQHNDPF